MYECFPYQQVIRKFFCNLRVEITSDIDFMKLTEEEKLFRVFKSESVVKQVTKLCIYSLKMIVLTCLMGFLVVAWIIGM